MPSPLDGKTCIVTGAGRGIGRMIAIDLASQGADVVLCARTAADLAETARMIEGQRGSITVHAIDVSDMTAVARLAHRCETGAPAFALVNCAGILGPVGRLDTIDMTRWIETLAVNLIGTAAACAAFAPQMISAGGGSIVNFSGGGIGGPSPAGNMSAYVASKAGVVALTESLAIEFAGSGLRVNAIAPGAIPTTFSDEILERGPDVAGPMLYSQTVRQRDSPARLEPVLALVRFLIAPDSGHVSGRLLSARWEQPSDLDELAVSGSRFTLRRIDGVLFDEVDSSGGPR